MKNLILIVVTALTLIPLFPACAEESQRPRNIRVEVEYKQSGKTQEGIGIAKWDSGKNSSCTKQFIVVSDGLSGNIFVGREVPFVNYYGRFLFDHGYIEGGEQIAIKQVGTKLKVEPRIIGENTIEITLTPEISFLMNKKFRTIDITTLTTTVTASDGRPITIGGLQKDEEFDKYFFGTASHGNIEIILTPKIQ